MGTPLHEIISSIKKESNKYINFFRSVESHDRYKKLSIVFNFFKELNENDIKSNIQLFTKYESDINDFVNTSGELYNYDNYTQMGDRAKQNLYQFAIDLENGLIKEFQNHKNKDKVKNEQNTNSLEELVDIYRGEFRKAQKEAEGYREAAENIIEDLEKKRDNELKIITDNSKEILEIKSYAKSAKDAFDEDHKLYAAREYWQNKAKRHNTSAIWAFSFFFVPIFIIIGLMLFQSKKLIVSDSNQTIIDTITTINEESLLNFVPYLVIFSLLIWISRIFLKVAFSNLHLQEEAVEKETQILTYLSLIKEGAGLEKEDRKLILEAIFRPSTNGLIKDESNVTLLDIANIFKGK